MIIILEGPDATGKTSLANQLARVTGWPVMHEGPPKEHAPLYRWYQKKLLAAPDDCILDRGFHGEQVYGPLVRGASRIDDFELQALEMLAWRRNVLMLWCTADVRDISARLIESREPIDIQVRTDPKPFLDAYETLRVKSHLRGGTYDSSREDPFQRAAGFKSTGAFPNTPSWVRGVGNWRASTVLVGDELSEGGVLPFDSGPAARYLFKTVISRDPRGVGGQAPWGMHDLYITNSLSRELGRVRSHVALAEELSHFSGAEVFCLGEKALRRVRQAAPNRPLRYADHPQFRNRFHHHDVHGYRGQFA